MMYPRLKAQYMLPRRSLIPIKEAMIDWWGPVLHEYYAGTEGNGFVMCNSEAWLAHKGTVGQPVNCQVHICDENGEEVPVGEEGSNLLRERQQI